ncbi:transcriptional regulator family: Fungal Specific TF [Penicillium psychrosexuale]|uniref:transcriptional regulator family: Fungal Specific TF n=1 Tax=Penicillium psychrosexuale TaxID=1002107 RepID=UPI002545746C|nr:transcriptional regulator family: Fungal Specific TF [Penicillium psychrosexuale]KAJ5799187.1 transcriptional regulator family: Fungal Specific TF [Penicillium psychrosexuale]
MSLPPEYEGEASLPTPNDLSEPKRHAACDECRKRKLKCSGELAGCSRCIKQSLSCNYSIQKQMGRPPKKRTRTDDEGVEFPGLSGTEIWPSPEDFQQSSLGMSSNTVSFPDTDHLCPQLFWRPGTNMNLPQCQSANLLSGYEDHNHMCRQDRPKQSNLPVPASSSPWPDFSAISEATAMPMPFPNPPAFPSTPLSPATSVSSDSTASGCPCLSYLYLSLSHMTSISSFPVNSHTLCSLYIAARTARNVIRCQVCPKIFSTGLQNIMFIGTLLTVVADSWLRVAQTDPVELGMQSAPPQYVSEVLQSPDPAQVWKSWLHQVVRRAVIGGPVEPGAIIVCSQQPDLLSMIIEIENRQRRWHEPGQHPSRQWNSMSIPEPAQSQDQEDSSEKEFLCLRVVGSARDVIKKFNFDPSEYPEGVEPVTARNKAHTGAHNA